MNTGAAIIPARGQDVDHMLETPFASDGYAAIGSSPAVRPQGPSYELNTPFLSEYGLERTSTLGPRAELFASLMAELHDSEFEAAVTDLVHEASALAQDRLSVDGAEPGRDRQQTLRGLREMFEPLQREAEAAIDRLGAQIGETDLAALQEGEIETFLDRFDSEMPVLQPAFEEFLKSLVKKAKKAVSGAVKLAKKGVKLASKLSPVHLILGKLKALVRPLLERVLRFALDKLPVALRPVARQLAQKFLRVGELEVDSEEEEGEAAAADPATITREMDARLVSYAVDGEEGDRSAAEHFAQDEETASADAWLRLQRARMKFAREIVDAESDAEAAPVVEQFVPAVLAGLKLGISVVGRPRVVNFLSGLIAKFIGKYVGQAQAAPLSRALVGAGLRLGGLEAAVDGVAPAGEALAATVEETVNRVVQTAPDSAWQNQVQLEEYVRDAFARAASANFPDDMIRTELHEAADTSGAWELMPRESSAKLYKKYSRVLEVSLTPQILEAVTSFGGVTLSAIVRDQLGVGAQSIRARAHLYEIVTGTTVGAIAANEKQVRGLGRPSREAWSLLHPLTPEAAAALFKEPGLGRAAAPRFLADRNVLEVGQRLYYLELPEGMVRQPMRGSSRTMRRTGGVKVVMDLAGGKLRIRRFYSEPEAQAIASAVRKRAPAGVVLGALKRGLERRLATHFSGSPTRAVRIVHESVHSESLLPSKTAMLLRAAGRPLVGTLTRWVLDGLTRELQNRYDAFGAEIVRAADADAEGFTLTLTFSRPGFFNDVKALLGGNLAAAARLQSARMTMPEYALTIRPGYDRSRES